MNIKNRISAFCLIVSSILAMSSYAQSTGFIRVTLKGEVKDRPQSSQLLLLKHGEDPRVNGVNIPINNGQFEYILNCGHEELYELIFDDELQRGMWRPIEFVSEQGVINFTLHPLEQFDKNIVEGGNLNKEYRNYYSKLFEKHTAIGNELNAKIEQLSKDGVDITSTAKALQETAYQELFNWQIQYVRENPSIVGYSILVSGTRQILQSPFNVSPYIDVYQTIFAPKFPDHPYSVQMRDMLAGSLLQPGVPHVDFTAVDLNNNLVRLFERISGKLTVLYLWASWCGPCRRDGIALIPVYEEFRDKGFVVIGVARERSISSAEAAIKMDKYPWENLVELNDAEQIWVKYGIGNAGGSIFLIDEKGNIAAVAPTVEEIRDFLTKKLK